MMAVFLMCAAFGRRLMAEGRRELKRSEKGTMLSPKGCREQLGATAEEGIFFLGIFLVGLRRLD